MKRKTFLSSGDWVAYFYENAQSAALSRPAAVRELALDIRRALAASLTAWQLGETSEGNHLRAAARQYAEAHDDPAFLSAVEFFIREEQRHGAALGDWLDRVGIPRKSRDLGDSLFRFCRYAIPNYAVWASIVVMVESMAEIYYTAVRRLVPCVRLKLECTRILADEVRHIQFQCEHLAFARRHLSLPARLAVQGAEAVFYGVVCTAVWVAHGRLMRLSGLPFRDFAQAALRKYRVIRHLTDPSRYAFPDEHARPVIFPVRLRR